MIDGNDLRAEMMESTRSELTVEQLLHRLISDAETPGIQHLSALSDLSLREAQQVRDLWSSIPVERRRIVINELVQTALDELDLHLGRLLRIALNDADAQVRAAAVAGLWEEVEGDLVGDFVQMLYNDPDVSVRAAAAKNLGNYILAGELDELEASLAMRAENALLDMVESPDEPLPVRCSALESIAYSGEVGVRQLIEDAYYSPDEEMRVSSLVAMGRSADIRWRGLLRAELQNPEAAMRAQAAIACGELEATAARDELIALLLDPDAEVRLAAIFALGRIGGQEAVEAVETLAAEGNPDEVEAAQTALEEMAFYAERDDIALFDESLDDTDEWDADFWDPWYDADDADLGSYE